jgi:hypothetical protein
VFVADVAIDEFDLKVVNDGNEVLPFIDIGFALFIL